MNLEVTGLTKTYGKGRIAVNAVRDATFTIEEGQFTAIVGPSGSGKTTMLSMLGGLLTPTSGSINMDGQYVEKLTSREKQIYRRDHVGFIFQTNNLLPFLTARENLLLMSYIGPGGKHAMRQRAQQLLDEMELIPRSDALSTELSGGERQRVAIARALMRDPDIVLADEPTANLDSELGQLVVQTLRNSVKDRNKIGLMVTHDLDMASLADFILEMRDGQVTRGSLNRSSI